MTDPSVGRAGDRGRAVEPPDEDAPDAPSGAEGGEGREGSEGAERAETDTSGAWTPLSTSQDAGEEPAQNMIPARVRRRTKLERGSMRVLATGGIIGLATLLGAVLVSQDVAGWIVGLTVGLTSVILAALLWSSRQL